MRTSSPYFENEHSTQLLHWQPFSRCRWVRQPYSTDTHVQGRVMSRLRPLLFNCGALKQRAILIIHSDLRTAQECIEQLFIGLDILIPTVQRFRTGSWGLQRDNIPPWGDLWASPSFWCLICCCFTNRVVFAHVSTWGGWYTKGPVHCFKGGASCIWLISKNTWDRWGYTWQHHRCVQHGWVCGQVARTNIYMSCTLGTLENTESLPHGINNKNV